MTAGTAGSGTDGGQAGTPGEAALLAEAAAALGQGLAVFGADHRLRAANPAFRRLLARTGAPLVPGSFWAEILGAAAAAGFYRGTAGHEAAFVRGVLDRTAGFSARFDLECADGRWLAHRFEPLAGGGGVLTLTDVTERNRAHEDMLDIIEDALGSVSEGFSLWDRDGRLVSCNQAFAELFGDRLGAAAQGAGLEALILDAVSTGYFALPEEEPAGTLSAPGASREMTVRLPDGRFNLLAVHPTRGGRAVLTTRDVTEERRARDAEREAARLIARVMDACPATLAMSRLDDGRILYSSPASEAVFGPCASIGEQWADPAERGGYLDRLRREGRVDAMPVRLRDRAGRVFPAQISARLMEHGGETVVVASATDLTDFEAQRAATDRANAELREAVTSLEEARALLDDALESLEEGIALLDGGLCLVLTNARFRALLLPRGGLALPGKPVGALFARLAGAGHLCLPGGGDPAAWAAEMEARIRAHERGVELGLAGGRVLLMSAHPTGFGGHLVTIRDITEQRRAEQAEREADMLLRKIVDACPVTFLVSRVSDGKIIYAPPPTRARYGRIDSTLSFFLRPEDRQTYLDALLPTGSLDDYRVRFRRQDGSILEGLTSARVTEYKGEAVIVSSTRDISEQLAMQAELERQREIAHQTEKLSALGELLAGVAHELNNPLSIVVGYALMLDQQVTDPALTHRVGRIRTAAERCAKIVRTFLAMARQRPARIEPCDINGILRDALDVAGYGLRAAGARIELDLAAGLPPVAADPDQIAQVFTNLIVNAEQAMAGQPGPQGLILESRLSEGAVVVTVRDTGPGIAEEIRARIFEPFFTTKDVGVGTGIGLAFCHRIVESHGGRLWVESVPGEGAAFSVALAPCRSREAEAGEDGQAAPAPAGLRVLVVDDEPDVCDLMAEILAEAGCEVTACTDARTALARVAAGPFDAILSDMRMPGMDGPELLAALEARAPAMARRLAFVTGDVMSPGVAAFLERSGRPHLAKPAAPEDLLGLIRRIVTAEGEAP